MSKQNLNAIFVISRGLILKSFYVHIKFRWTGQKFTKRPPSALHHDQSTTKANEGHNRRIYVYSRIVVIQKREFPGLALKI